MSRFSLQISFTTPAWLAILDDSHDPLAVVRAPVESLGGELHEAFFIQGAFDILAITEFPESVSHSELSIAFYADGTVACIHASPLLTASQVQEARRQAASLTYPYSPHPRALAASAT
jgi:uncharacterized protein with GYD domain